MKVAKVLFEIVKIIYQGVCEACSIMSEAVSEFTGMWSSE